MDFLKKVPINRKFQQIDEKISKLGSCPDKDICPIEEKIKGELMSLFNLPKKLLNLFKGVSFDGKHKQKYKNLIRSLSKQIDSCPDKIHNLFLNIRKKILKEKEYLHEIIFEELTSLKKQLILDPLTGCYNRFFLDEVIDTLKEEKIPFYYMIIDINGLKEFNDFYGYETGNKLISFFADFLKKEFSEKDYLIFRVYGDEFVIIKPFEKNKKNINIENIEKEMEDLMVSLQEKENKIVIESNGKNIVKDVSFAIGGAFSAKYSSIGEMVRDAVLNMKNNKSDTKGYDIRRLPYEIEGLKNRIDGLLEENEGLIKEKEGLLKENEGLRLENEGLRKRNEGLLEENEGLIKKNKELQKEKEYLEKLLNELKKNS